MYYSQVLMEPYQEFSCREKLKQVLAALFQVEPCALLQGEAKLAADQKIGIKAPDLYAQITQLQIKLISAYEQIEELN